MKTLFVTLLLISIVSIDSIAQVGTAWYNLYNHAGSEIDQGRDGALDAAGNLYVTGSSASDILLVKYNQAGVLQWARTHTGTASSGDIGKEVRVDAAGNVYVGGIIKNADSQNDIALLKYNSAGVQQWVRIITGTNPAGIENFGDIALDGSGNVYLTGTVGDTATGYNAITIKFNPAGVE